MTAEELAGRLEALEADRDRLDEITRHLVGVVELLAEQAGAQPATTAAPSRPRLRVLHGGRS